MFHIELISATTSVAVEHPQQSEAMVVWFFSLVEATKSLNEVPWSHFEVRSVIFHGSARRLQEGKI